jgi:hypothetical protein
MKYETVMAPEAMRAWVEKEYDSTFWGMPVRVRPAMCPTVIGDGGKLAYLTPINERPNHFAILVPSWYTEDDLRERSELLIQTIEEVFGNSDRDRETDEEDQADEAADKWPIWSDGGHSYGFITDAPDDVLEATRQDIERQLKEQRALFVGLHRVHPGTLLTHPEFGQVHARHNEALGWHYCRMGTMYECMPGSIGYATDFSCVTVVLDSEGEPKRSMSSCVGVRLSTPGAGPVKGGQAGGEVSKGFPRVLTGMVRARAHYALLAALGERSATADEEVLELAKMDPSLFLEPIPAADPFGRGMHNVWSAQSAWYGNWLTKAAANGFPKTIGALMARGLHPDDPAAFLLRPLIWHEAWNENSENLRLALAHGANPDSPESWSGQVARARPDMSLARRYLGAIASNMLSFSIYRNDTVKPETTESLVSNVRRLEQLLDAGARKLDPIYGIATADDGKTMEYERDNPSAISSVSGFLSALKAYPELHAMLLELACKLCRAGASITMGHDKVAPVLDAVRGQDAAALETYIRLGGSVRDEDIVNDGHPMIGTLLDEATKAGGPEWRAEVAETLMRTALQPQPTAPERAARRRRAMLV